MTNLFATLSKSKYYPLGIISLRVGLGLLFIYASLDKIWHPDLFAKAISNYRILPLPLLHIAAIVLPWVEFVSGMALLSNRYPRAANIIIGSLTLVFTIAILSAMSRGLDFNCGCFKVSSDDVNIGSLKILQNFGLLLVSGILERYYRKT